MTSLPTKGGGTTTHSYRKSVFSCSYRNGIPSSLSFLTTFLCLLPISLSNTVSLPSFVQLLTIFSVHPFFFLSFFSFLFFSFLFFFHFFFHFFVATFLSLHITFYCEFSGFPCVLDLFFVVCRLLLLVCCLF